MAIELVDFPIKNGGSFHSYATTYTYIYIIWISFYKKKYTFYINIFDIVCPINNYTHKISSLILPTQLHLAPKVSQVIPKATALPAGRRCHAQVVETFLGRMVLTKKWR